MAEQQMAQNDIDERAHALEDIVHGNIETIETEQSKGRTCDVTETGKKQLITCNNTTISTIHNI